MTCVPLSQMNVVWVRGQEDFPPRDDAWLLYRFTTTKRTRICFWCSNYLEFVSSGPTQSSCQPPFYYFIMGGIKHVSASRSHCHQAELWFIEQFTRKKEIKSQLSSCFLSSGHLICQRKLRLCASVLALQRRAKPQHVSSDFRNGNIYWLCLWFVSAPL